MGVVKAFVIIFLCVAIFGPSAYFFHRLFIAPGQIERMEKSRPRAPLPPDVSIAEFDKCLKVKNSGDLLAARTALDDFVAQNPDSPKIEEAKDALGEVNTDIFFSTIPSPEKQQYVVQNGDTLSAIEKKTHVSGEFIVRSNNIEDAARISIGQVLIVSRPDFIMQISRKAQTVTLLNKGKFFKQYRVKAWNAPATKSTAPVNTRIIEKIAWKKGQRVTFGSKDYAGSARWIALGAAGYTLYTDAPVADGAKPPAGLGLDAEEMEELSTLLNKNTPVTIQ
jgi:LysM repeat protein